MELVVEKIIEMLENNNNTQGQFESLLNWLEIQATGYSDLKEEDFSYIKETTRTR